MRVDINALLRADPVSCRYGAPMGRYNRVGECTLGLYCQRVRFVDGDYSADGTYWGSGGSPLWAIFSLDLETLTFVRAPSRAHAIAKARDQHGDRNLFFSRDEARPADM